MTSPSRLLEALSLSQDKIHTTAGTMSLLPDKALWSNISMDSGTTYNTRVNTTLILQEQILHSLRNNSYNMDLHVKFNPPSLTS